MELIKNLFVALFWILASVLGVVYGITKFTVVISAVVIYHLIAFSVGFILLLITAGGINLFIGSK